MTLYHHDGREYSDAASAAAKHARDKIGSMIEKGKGRAMEVLHQINTDVPADFVAAGPQLTWNIENDNLRLGLGNHDLGVHAHALGQACGKVNLPIRYARDLNGISEWGQDLLAHNLNELYRRNDKRHLVRAVHGEARGILSDKYKRLDSRPIVEAFAQEVAQYGAVPIEGYALDTKIALKALMPTVYEPVENEIMAIGMVLQNSDFGNGALSLRLFLLRLWCTNYAIANECLRKVHLGGRLPDNIEFSQATIDLETAAVTSAMRDIVRSSLAKDKVERLMQGVRAAHEAKVSGTAVAKFLKDHFNKTEALAITETFNGAEIEMLPPGQNRWRLSNAISWIAGQTEDEGRRLEMQQVAGKAMLAAKVNEEEARPVPTVFDFWNQAGANVAPKPAPAPAPEYDENEVNPRFVGMELN
jgi:hypothetical protein